MNAYDNKFDFVIGTEVTQNKTPRINEPVMASRGGRSPSPPSKLDDAFWKKVEAEANKHPFMSGVERSDERVAKHGEVFTPTALVIEIIRQLPEESFTDPTKTFLDPSCGDGQFLVAVKWAKMFCGQSLEVALSNTFGVELNADNAEVCRKRLLDGHEEFRPIVERNIVVADGLTYHYRFDGTSSGTLSESDFPDII